MAIDSETSIYNLALSAIGARSNITSPSEASREAEVCTLWYEAIRDQVLAAAHWPEATKFEYLALRNEQTDGIWAAGEAAPGFTYSYQAPVDMLRPQFLSNFSPFRVTENAGNTTINSNAHQAILTYTFRNKLVSRWSSGLQMAVMYGLAANICLPLTGKTQRANLMLAKANDILLKARETSANWNEEQFESVPEWLQVRGYGATPTSRFIYPMGNLLTAAA